MNKYINYHCHSYYSNSIIADSPVSPKEYIERIKELGHTTYVSTEHGISFNWAEKYLLCKENNIKFVFGVEGYILFNEKVYHIMFVAKNKNGMIQLNRLISDAVINNFKYSRPRVTIESIKQFINPNDVITTSACFLPNIKVRTLNGEKNIQEITSEDYVLTHNNIWEKVNFPTQRDYDGEICSITFDRSNKKINCTNNHKFLTYKDGDIDWIEAQFIEKNNILLSSLEDIQYTNNNIIEFKKSFIDNIKSTRRKNINYKIELDYLDMMTFGNWVADGSMNKTNGVYRVCFSVNLNEFDNYYNKFIKHTMDKFGVIPYIRIEKNHNRVDLIYNSKELYDWFNQLFNNCKAINKHIPGQLKNINEEFNMALLFGYFLGDGSFIYDKKKGGRMTSCSISKKLHLDLCDLLKTLNCFPSERYIKGKIDKNGVNHQDNIFLDIYNSNIGKIKKTEDIDITYNIFKNNIKKTSSAKNIVFVNNKRYMKRYVDDNIKYNYSGKVYCLNVGESHSFNCEGIIVHNCIGGCLKEPTLILVKELYKHFKDNFYLEVAYHKSQRQIEINKLAQKISKDVGIKLIAGNDSHYIYPEQKILRDELLASRRIVYADEEDDETQFYMDYPDYDTMFNRFKEQEMWTDDEIKDFIDRTNMIENFDDIEFDNKWKVPTLYPNLSEQQRKQLLIDEANKRWSEYKKHIPEHQHKEYINAIRWELDEWLKCNMQDYLLTASELVKKGVELGGVVTMSGRGSAASYITTTLFGLSTIDRIQAKVPLLPERFMTADRIIAAHSTPDYDINVYNREKFIEAQDMLLGEEMNYQLCAYGTLQKKSAFRMLCKIRDDITVDQQLYITSKIEEFERDYKYAGEEDRELMDIRTYITDIDMYELYLQANKFLGTVTDIKGSPCSWCIANDNLMEIFGLCRAKNGDILLNIEGNKIESFGYLKMDWLIVDAVGIIDAVYKEIGIPIPTSNELYWLIQDDKATWDIYGEGITCCVNQCEQAKSKAKVMKYKPKSIEELCAFVAGIRPGFISNYDKFEKREHMEFGIEELDKLLQGKFLDSSWMLYQEQIMLILNYCGFEPKETYDILKAISKKKEEKIRGAKDKFFEKMHTLLDKYSEEKSNEIIESIWQVIVDSSSYNFNSSHAYSMAHDSVWIAYAKAHYPQQTYVGLIKYFSNLRKLDKIRTLKQEAEKYFGIKLMDRKFGQDNRVINVKDNVIYQSLDSIKGINSEIAQLIYTIKDQHFNTFDLYLKLKDLGLNKTHIGNLCKINYFRDSDKLLWLTNNYKEYKQLNKSKMKDIYDAKIMDCTEEVLYYELVEACNKETSSLLKFDNPSTVSNILFRHLTNIDISDIQRYYWEMDLIGEVITPHPNNTKFYIVEKYNENKGSILLYNPEVSRLEWFMYKRGLTIANKNVIMVGDIERKEKGLPIIKQFMDLTSIFKNIK